MRASFLLKLLTVLVQIFEALIALFSILFLSIQDSVNSYNCRNNFKAKFLVDCPLISTKQQDLSPSKFCMSAIIDAYNFLV